MKNIFITLIILLLVSCTNENDANKALGAMGFNNIEITGYTFFTCSKDDFFHTGFKAVNSNGKAVAGTVCSGLFFKNSTLRFG